MRASRTWNVSSPTHPLPPPLLYYTQLLEHDFAADLANIHAACREHDEGKQWQRFLAAVAGGLDSVTEYESSLPAADGEPQDPYEEDEWDDAGDTFEGYNDDDDTPGEEY